MEPPALPGCSPSLAPRLCQGMAGGMGGSLGATEISQNIFLRGKALFLPAQPGRDQTSVCPRSCPRCGWG